VQHTSIARASLRELGKREGEEFEYVEYGDIGHNSVDIEHKVRNFRLIADFFERVL
jgi:dipeptidyl aminopeptidase/acylaminoacyl peptidase